MKKSELIKQFEFELRMNVVEMNKIRRFNRLQQVFEQYGYYEGAKILLNKDETEGLVTLFDAGKTEISIEFLALSEKFQSLFSDDELKKCRRKLGI